MLLPELEVLKKQEELDEQLAAKKRQSAIRKKQEAMDKLTKGLEIAKLEDEKEVLYELSIRR